MDNLKKDDILEEKELSLGERLKLGGNGRLCRCGKSKKYPHCDGSHTAS